MSRHRWPSGRAWKKHSFYCCLPPFTGLEEDKGSFGSVWKITAPSCGDERANTLTVNAFLDFQACCFVTVHGSCAKSGGKVGAHHFSDLPHFSNRKVGMLCCVCMRGRRERDPIKMCICSSGLDCSAGHHVFCNDCLAASKALSCPLCRTSRDRVGLLFTCPTMMELRSRGAIFGIQGSTQDLNSYYVLIKFLT